jgi:hypothetical protein
MMTPKYFVRKYDTTVPNQIEYDEPCFVIRATDRFAAEIVGGYYALLQQRYSYGKFGSEKEQKFLADVAEHLARIHRWQAENPDKVKNPD